MNKDSVSSVRWQSDTHRTPSEWVVFWKGKAFEYRQHRDQLLAANERLASRVASLERALSHQLLFQREDRRLFYRPQTDKPVVGSHAGFSQQRGDE